MATPASSGPCRSPQPRRHTGVSTATTPLNVVRRARDRADRSKASIRRPNITGHIPCTSGKRERDGARPCDGDPAIVGAAMRTGAPDDPCAHESSWPSSGNAPAPTGRAEQPIRVILPRGDDRSLRRRARQSSQPCSLPPAAAGKHRSVGGNSSLRGAASLTAVSGLS